MKTAIYKNQTIHIEKVERERFQMLYQSGKNGELSCPVCQKTVRLYLGIEREPHFYHLQSSKNPCEDTPVSINASKLETIFIERNGFRYPQSREITPVSIQVETTFRTAKTLVTDRPFIPTIPTIQKRASYLTNLSAEGIDLDANQVHAVLETKGAVLVLAGAGSGKTRVLTARTAYMIEAENIDPASMMLLTFTSKAAAEMKSRMLHYPGMKSGKINQIVAGTFHSIFYRILLFHEREKWSSERLLKKDWERDRILKLVGKEMGLNEKEFAFDLALQQIGYWKNSLYLPHLVQTENEWEEKALVLYKRYEELKKKEGKFDFDDMLVGCYQLFQDSPFLLEKYQERFQHLLIDEFQDINKVQYELVKLFSAKKHNICAVGDDDQSIYSFRGSNPGYLLEFENDFPNAKVIHLSENYRSSHEIVTTANQIITSNQQRRLKKMNAHFAGSKHPVTFHPFDEEEEATMVVTDIQEKIMNGAKPADFAILYRTHASARAIFERLANSSLPFRIDMDAESFYDRRTVKSILAFLRLSLNEDDHDALSYAIAPLFLKQTAIKDIKAASILEDCTFLETLTHIKTGHAFQENKLKKAVGTIRSLKHLRPLAALKIIEKELGFQEYLKKRGNEGNKIERSSDDLKDLKVAAKNFESIVELLEHAKHMSAMNKEIKSMSKQKVEAITLSTIHRSKGLEYNTVYVLGTVDGSIPHDFALESLRNGDRSPIEEERRLLYVAVTRAKYCLYISIPETRRGKKAGRSRFLKTFK